MTFGDGTYDEYLRSVEAFHGTAAPGLLLGWHMVRLAAEHLPAESLVDVFCETKACLPDAIQLLTPCSYGNGWLKVLDLGRFAAVFYDKHTGIGVRIHLDPARLEPWDEVQAWFLKRKRKDEQDANRLIGQIHAAGTALFGVQPVQVPPQHRKKAKLGRVALCPTCGESYPESHGPTCRGCSQDLPYKPIEPGSPAPSIVPPERP